MSHRQVWCIMACSLSALTCSEKRRCSGEEHMHACALVYAALSTFSAWTKLYTSSVTWFRVIGKANDEWRVIYWLRTSIAIVVFHKTFEGRQVYICFMVFIVLWLKPVRNMSLDMDPKQVDRWGLIPLISPDVWERATQQNTVNEKQRHPSLSSPWLADLSFLWSAYTLMCWRVELWGSQ